MPTYSYVIEFLFLMCARMAKPNCRHCGSIPGIAGRNALTHAPILCQCVVQKIKKYRALTRPRFRGINAGHVARAVR